MRFFVGINIVIILFKATVTALAGIYVVLYSISICK